MTMKKRRWFWPGLLAALAALTVTVWMISTNEPFPEQRSPETNSSANAQFPDIQGYSITPKPLDDKYHNGVPFSPGVEPKGGYSELSPEESAEEREELLEQQTKALLVPLLRTDAPPERVLKDLVSLSCSQPASNYPFWDMANEVYQLTISKGRRLLINDWPPILALAYNDKCVALKMPSGMPL